MTPASLLSLLLPVAAIVLQIAMALLYVGLTVLVVPAPLFYAFWAVWGIGLVLVIGLALSRRFTLAFVLPMVYLFAFFVILWIGEAFLGWGH